MLGDHYDDRRQDLKRTRLHGEGTMIDRSVVDRIEDSNIYIYRGLRTDRL